MKIYIWGTGKGARKVLQAIRKESCQVEGFIDNDPAKHGELFENKKIIYFREIKEDYDYIIISTIGYDAILYQLEAEKYENLSKIIIFFDNAYCNNYEYSEVLDQQKWKIILLEQRIETLEKTVNARFNNLGYEIIDKYKKNMYEFPQMGDTEEAVDKIVNNKCSLVRFGDGEFEIMAGKERAPFQSYSPKLAERLLETISSKDERLLIGIANNYGSLELYTESTANGIRGYMDENTRRFHMSVLDKNRMYYDAYMFKSYFPYKNREETWNRVELVKKIWHERDVIIVEGDKTRTGFGNDLFDNAKSLQRILCPIKNAFDKYDDILKTLLGIGEDCLILVALGPAGKVLIYDLVNKGYQAVDIGQIDMDYEWYKAGVGKRIPIPDKYVSQLPPAEILEINDTEYLNQIIAKIC